jgi:hypothetical protein
MTFWRKQLTAKSKRENLPAPLSSVKRQRARRKRRVARVSRWEPHRSRKLQVASLPPPVRSPAVMSRTQRVRPPRPTERLEGYVYRRPLSLTESLPAVGAGVAAGLAVFYVARLFLQRTPLLPEERRLGKHHTSGSGRGPRAA